MKYPICYECTGNHLNISALSKDIRSQISIIEARPGSNMAVAAKAKIVELKQKLKAEREIVAKHTCPNA